MINTKLEMTEEEFYTRGGMLDKLMATAFDSCILLDAEGFLVHAAHNSEGIQSLHETSMGKHFSEFNRYAYYAMDTLKTHMGHWGVTEVIQERKCLFNIFPIFCGEKFLGLLGTNIYSSLESLNKILAQLHNPAKGENTEGIYDALAKMGNNHTFQDFVGESPQARAVIEQCRRAASTRLPILILGESGSGKEILADAIHSATVDRTWDPFVRLNCSAIPKDLMESELFGHEKGAFTGATTTKKGKFELAAGGSILLDEIGDMEYGLQSKLLRVLEEKEFERVGGTRMLPMTARIISATNANLREKSRQGTFRSDLYYRLSTIEITVPPLRERAEDIPLLVEHIIHRDNLDVSLDKGAWEALCGYGWPGNVRELRNVLNRLGLFHAGESMSAADVCVHLEGEPQTLSPARAPVPQDVREAHRQKRLMDALRTTNFDIPAAAEQLGVCRATVYNWMHRYGVKR